MDDIERALLIKNEVFVYKIPPRASAKGYRAADWKLDAPDWTGRLRCIEKGAVFKKIIPTQNKNQPKAGFSPSGYIIFGQQKTCTPIRIFQTSHRGWSTAKIMYEIL